MEIFFFFVTRFSIIFKHKCSYLKPLLSITFPQGFRICKNIGHPTSGSGGKKTFKRYLKSEHTDTRTDRQTDKSTCRKHRPRGPMLWKILEPLDPFLPHTAIVRVFSFFFNKTNYDSKDSKYSRISNLHDWSKSYNHLYDVWENVHHPLCVMGHMSNFKWQASNVTCLKTNYQSVQ